MRSQTVSGYFENSHYSKKTNCMKNGNLLETTLKIVQESLIDKPDTKVFKNYKIKNNSGVTREFDVAIISTANNFDFLTVIECKDYNRPVSLEKIDAFQSKCQGVPSINKKVFVSKKGYQSGASKTAKDLGIELYSFEDVGAEIIKDWLTINYIAPARSSIILDQVIITVDPICKDKDFLIESRIEREDGSTLGTIKDLANEVIFKSGNFNDKMIIGEGIKSVNKCEKHVLEINPTELLYIKSSKAIKYKILEIIIEFTFKIEELPFVTNVEKIKSSEKDMSTIVTHDTDGFDLIKLVLKDGDPNEFTPYIINKVTGDVFTPGFSIKYEKLDK